MLTPNDLKDSKNASGYRGVITAGGRQDGGTERRGKPWAAAVNGPGTGSSHSTYIWRGPRRATGLEAAQDYCDYINSGQGPRPRKNKSAGHKHPKQPQRPMPQEVKDALGVLRDYNAQKRGEQGYVYLIVEDLPGLRYGKIGFSVNPEKRVAELQTGNPRKLALHLKMKGTEADERALHAKYAKFNVLQEWFLITKELLLEWPASALVRGKAVA